MNALQSRFVVMVFIAIGAADLASAQQASAPKDMNTCAGIETQAERLACYDRLAGRKEPQPGSPTSAATGVSAATPSAATPASPTATSPDTTPKTPRTPTPVGAAGNSGGSPAQGTREAFGLYEIEHPAAPKSPIDSITAKVVKLDHDTYGRETVSLEGGAVWQLAGSDPLLANGDAVTIKRAALGSYILATPSGRTHRARRLR